MVDPLVISHRTHMGTHPENSLAGIAAALAEGVDGIEIDVRASADGVPLLLHDATLARTHRDPRALATLTAAEARALGVPALQEALLAISGRATLYIEVKERGLDEAVARAVRAADAAGWCWIWAFDPGAARECRAALPEVPVALNASPESPAYFGYDSSIEECARSGFAAVSLDSRLVTAGLVQQAHTRGLLVFTWTVDEPAEIERVLAAGVDGVCGNFPPRIRAVIQARRSGDAPTA
jgi:glycerophosphoryl diester phosphodiesterase